MAEGEGDLERRLPREIKLRGLRVLLAVAKQGSFRKAGRLLHLTQPAITAAIAELEQTLGVPLFERTARGVTPTAHGESFIGRASAIFGELRLAAEDIDIISRGSRGTLRVGTGGGGWGMGILPTALTKLLDPHPEAFILIREADEDALIELLKARKLDLFFSRLTPFVADPEIAYQPLFEDSICVLAHRTHPLAAHKQVSWEELANERWVAPPSGALSFDHVQRTLHKAGLAMPRHVIESTSAPLALGMVLQGNFLCFGTNLYYKYSVLKPMLTMLKVDLPKVKVAFGVVTLKERELNQLATRLIGLVAELARTSRNGHGIDDVTARPTPRGARTKSPAPTSAS
jgi:DNA-binding transcriptional LysR family regulator